MLTGTRNDSPLKLRTVLTIFVVIASAMAVFFALHAETDSSSAEVTDSGWCGPNAYYYIYSDGTMKIEGAGALYDYDEVHAPWYEHRLNINWVFIGDFITYLGKSTFLGCLNIRELTLPITLNSVVSDDHCAFEGCCNIMKVHFTSGNDGYAFGYAAYKGPDSWYQNTPWYQSKDLLKEITFEDGVRSIGSDAFRELNITSIVLPDSVVALGCHCFFNCEKLTDLTIPVSLNSYGNEDYPAFDGCTAIVNVKITRGNGVPFDYTNWSGRDESNSNLTPWRQNPVITKNVVISDDVTHLGEYMFYHCNIGELTLPISAISGDCDAFRCDSSFSYCYLQKVTITKGTGIGEDHSLAMAGLCLPWNRSTSLKSITVEEGVTYIGKSTFYKCCTENLVLPRSLVSIGNCMFQESNIKNLTIPISINAVGMDERSEFKDAHGIEKITFTPGTGYGYDYAAYKGSDSWYQMTPWYQCRDTLKEIVLEEGITHIGSDAFRELNIQVLVLPNSLESLGCHAFYSCIYLWYLSIPITLDSISSEQYPAFDQCDRVTTLIFTAGSDGVGVDYNNCAPFWCNPFHKPEHITLDSGITYIGNKTFAGYSFFGWHEVPLEITAESLSGHSFEKKDGYMYQNDPPLDVIHEISVSVCFAEFDRFGLNVVIVTDSLILTEQIAELR